MNDPVYDSVSTSCYLIRLKLGINILHLICYLKENSNFVLTSSVG
jgi:hypothetical protein